METYQCNSISQGIAIGKVIVIPDSNVQDIPQQSIQKDEIEAGWLRFQNAIDKTQNFIQTMIDNNNSEQAAIFATHSMMLMDTDFLSQIKNVYESSLTNIEYIVNLQVNIYADKLRFSGDAYLKERADDICDVFGKVISFMMGSELINYDSIPKDSIIVATSLSPSDMVSLVKRCPAGFILSKGGINSHIAILSRNFGIPAVTDFDKATSIFHNGDDVILDAIDSIVLKSPDISNQNIYKKKYSKYYKQQEKLSKFKNKNAKTKDGIEIIIQANIGSVEEAKIAFDEGAGGIGLMRTEFLFMNSVSYLSEEEQFNAYKSVLELADGKPVTIRTLDIGGDKNIDSITKNAEKNPLMGCRAIRYCLSNLDFFETQLRALLRASPYGNLKIMFPLISEVDQLEKAKSILETVKADLRTSHINFSDSVKIGIMIETPSAAILSDILAYKCDFFSIGTNDLTQYTLCVDRENNQVAPLFKEFHPAVLRLIKMTVANALNAGIPVSICGELASKPEGIAILMSMGVKNLSMSAKQINLAKKFLSESTFEEFSKLYNEVITLDSEIQAEYHISDFIKSHVKE